MNHFVIFFNLFKFFTKILYIFIFYNILLTETEAVEA